MPDDISTVSTLSGATAHTSHCNINTTTTVANTANTYSNFKLFDIMETNQQHAQQQQRPHQQNGTHAILPAHSFTIIPTTSAAASVSIIDNNNQSKTSTDATVRRSARLQTRPQPPVVTTMANGTSDGLINAGQMILFDADELQQHVMQQQHHNSGSNYMNM